MKILVLVKNVPEVAEAELEIDQGALDLEDLEMVVNEWDNYAVEEAVRITEASGGEVHLMTLGNEDDEDVLRRGLAMGAHAASHLCDEAFDGSDPATLARVIAAAVKDGGYDLILTGVQSADLGQASTGVLLAQELGLPHATMAIALEPGAGEVVVTRELENNTSEKVALPLPALVTVQSGINQPRYVSIMGIRKVRKMTIEQIEADDLGLAEESLGAAASMVDSQSLALPPMGEGAQMLEGGLDSVCDQAAAILREKGGLA
ncbi:MAG: electron transfer flavoprotein subunit beta/FixA family protein [Desulfarculus sp.]|nr:electron transfer flavoprotein subunit beta/FixA family protein [Pseudomonadota bacterium]MBU4598100.1 electron transfer flavoprotein subunit beta/FixA family protein [Pseudomonadota bacterium]MBV1717912.1 electron transfer flavoprotein subunit beta/FixA family protein [Desulfarculus sp.]MBV1739862.1 electron transfer flavoprotein subunit beta/FixA family protein [Desulfarculus sp.]MBV1751588.1 electron transfer flavoprotein subunit beta/FixA family protein [Desulfarculus sp.]